VATIKSTSDKEPYQN